MNQTPAPHLSDEQREVIERIKAWVDTEMAGALVRSGQVKAEINVKDNDIRANVQAFYQVN